MDGRGRRSGISRGTRLYESHTRRLWTLPSCFNCPVSRTRVHDCHTGRLVGPKTNGRAGSPTSQCNLRNHRRAAPLCVLKSRGGPRLEPRPTDAASAECGTHHLSRLSFLPVGLLSSSPFRSPKVGHAAGVQGVQELQKQTRAELASDWPSRVECWCAGGRQGRRGAATPRPPMFSRRPPPRPRRCVRVLNQTLFVTENSVMLDMLESGFSVEGNIM